MALYRNFETRDALDGQYLADEAVARAAITKCAAASEVARSRLAGCYGVSYGATADEYLDVFPCGRASAPVHIFIHGGYWRQLAPRFFSFVAERLVESGITVVIPNYGHCPAVTIDNIVEQCRAMLQWTVENAARFDGNPDDISLSGHSAGGHLAAMMAYTDRNRWHDFPACFLRGICAISGLFDLRPFPYTSLQADLRLTQCQVLRNSPCLLAGVKKVPLDLFVGEAETDEFHRQAKDYADACVKDGRQVRLGTVPSADHFNILDGFSDPSSLLFRAILSMHSNGQS